MTGKPMLKWVSLAAIAAAAASAGVAFADDSSMSMWTGDSYAYFNKLDNHPGSFNTARAPSGDAPSALVRSPRPDAVERRVIVAKSSTPRRTNPFRDDTAG
jgi:hypothetical protein